METLSKLIAEKLSYYTNDPTKRCVSSSGSCYYSGKIAKIESKGCFIGCQLSEEDSLKADEYFAINSKDSGLNDLIENEQEIGITIPQIIKDNIRLMRDMQDLHDTTHYWDTKGLTEMGKERLKGIISQHTLDEKDFVDILK